jgi:hypothetical protein
VFRREGEIRDEKKQSERKETRRERETVYRINARQFPHTRCLRTVSMKH